MITSGEGRIKDSTIGDGTIEREYKTFEAEELDQETDAGDKIKVLGDSQNIERGLHSMSLQPKVIASDNVGTMNSASPLNQSSLREFEIEQKNVQVGRATYHQGIKIASQGV